MEGGKLHGVLEEAGAGGQARLGEMLCPRIFIGYGGEYLVEVQVPLLGDYVELC